METKQETKSLPRNRKCGNCRYFEPAPLWRKGWCRNPRLYDRRANHLVDAATIDCEQVFRARIYWEPIPSSEPVEPVTASYAHNSVEESPVEMPVADGGNRIRRTDDGVLRPSVNRPIISRRERAPEAPRREKSTATPNVVGKASRTRKWLIENIPYYDKIDGPITRTNFMAWLPWVVIFVLLLVVLLNVTGNKKDSGKTTSTVPPVTASTTLAPILTPNAGQAGANPSSSTTAKATATLSSALPTATPVPPTSTPQAKVFAKVVGTGPSKALKMRKDPHITGPNEPNNVVVLIPEGEQVEVTGPFKAAEGFNWWPISYKGQAGWAVQDYLQKTQ